MNVDEHVAEAERLLNNSKSRQNLSEARAEIAMAQVHADLAQARALQGLHIEADDADRP